MTQNPLCCYYMIYNPSLESLYHWDTIVLSGSGHALRGSNIVGDIARPFSAHVYDGTILDNINCLRRIQKRAS
jgi:hypothetical protein